MLQVSTTSLIFSSPTLTGRRMASGLGLEETELRLGIPGGGSRGVGAEAVAVKSACKRGFAEIIDLKLQVHGPALDTNKEEEEEAAERDAVNKRPVQSTDPEKPPAAKAQVVGWPPVRSFRRNMACSGGEDRASGGGVKVSMDGAPYLRKVHLRKYRSYQDLSAALGNMFCSFAGAADRSLHGVNASCKVAPVDLANGSELYVPTYEDKDGDWMLVGDVPWELFVDSCKRLRIMKGSEAVGLAPREKEKQKNIK